MLIYVAFSLHSISCYKNIERIITKRILDCLFTTMMNMNIFGYLTVEGFGETDFSVGDTKKT